VLQGSRGPGPLLCRGQGPLVVTALQHHLGHKYRIHKYTNTQIHNPPPHLLLLFPRPLRRRPLLLLVELFFVELLLVLVDLITLLLLLVIVTRVLASTLAEIALDALAKLVLLAEVTLENKNEFKENDPKEENK
jgi:hypothetical protein